jgi:UDP-N-acetylbacillosamine N-acetyltransferase
MNHSNKTRKNIAIYGAREDASAKVILDTIRLQGEHIPVAFLDDDPNLVNKTVDGIPVVGGRQMLSQLSGMNVMGVAFDLGNNYVRRDLCNLAQACGLELVNAIHPSAIIASDALLGSGIWAAAGVIINSDVQIGDAVINTGATIDHNCIISSYINISPGCHLSGRTVIENYAFLGTGAISIPDIKIGAGAIVGAGAVMVSDVQSYTTVVGVPARVIKNNNKAQGGV